MVTPPAPGTSLGLSRQRYPHRFFTGALSLLSKQSMKCVICQNGHTQPGNATIVLERGDVVLVFRRVPAQICDNCGEEYVSADINRAVLQQANREAVSQVRLELLDFAA
jgi:YgiT-type zinc finger domain-containing protein